MEIVMVVTLAIMGIYFFKSADLPKELKERSAQLQAEASTYQAQKSFRVTIPEKKIQTEVLSANNKTEISAEIDKLTLIITTLEQQIRVNNEKNAEIQRMIDKHLVNLIQLQDKLNKLA